MYIHVNLHYAGCIQCKKLFCPFTFLTRIAFQHQEDDLAHKYLEDAGNFKKVANPSYKGETKDLKSILSFMDKVAEDTRNVVAEDITALKSAHVNDADIVRLAELNSFMAYQIRLITGLRLMKEAEDD